MKESFKDGDRVVLISTGHGDGDNNPVWEGSEGNVVGTIKLTSYKSLPEFIYHVKWDNKETNYYRKGDLGHFFAKGDKVRAIKKSIGRSLIDTRKSWRKFGVKFLTVDSIDKDYGTTIAVCNGDHYKITDLVPYVPAKPKNKFKIGDKVVPIGNTWSNIAPLDVLKETGCAYVVITYLPNRDNEYGIRSGNSTRLIKADRIIAYIEPKFNVGDKVIAVNKTRGSKFEYAQTIASAKSDKQEYLYVARINSDGCNTYYSCDERATETSGDHYNPSDLVLYSEPQVSVKIQKSKGVSQKMKTGDKVSTRAGNGVIVGVATIGSEKRFVVKFDDGFEVGDWTTSYLTFTEDNLEVIEAPIKLGDFEVEFRTGGIQVGCTPVSDKQILAIAKRRNLI